MSLTFNDTTTYRGLVQIYEKECGLTRGDISGNTNALKELTADINLAFDDYLSLALTASGVWQWDDSNHTDYPFITTDLVAGQRDYAFTVDGSSNLILQIYKVMVADESGYYREITPVDQESPNSNKTNVDTFINGQNTQGMPTRYDLTGNGIFLDKIPSYNYTNGLKVFINREPSYFAYTDTTKKAGIPGIHHRFLVLNAAIDFARRNNKPNYDKLVLEKNNMIRSINEYFSLRDRQTPRRITPNYQNNK